MPVRVTMDNVLTHNCPIADSLAMNSSYRTVPLPSMCACIPHHHTLLANPIFHLMPDASPYGGMA